MNPSPADEHSYGAATLADRLKHLREQAQNAPSTRGPPSPQPVSATSVPHLAAPPQTQSPGSLHHRVDTASHSGTATRLTPPPPTTSMSSADQVANYDELLGTDDGFLEDLLRDEGFDPGFGIPLPLDTSAEVDRLNDLAQRFSQLAIPKPHSLRVEAGDDSDDSTGEEMARNVECIVSGAVSNTKNALADGKTEDEPRTGSPQKPGDLADGTRHMGVEDQAEVKDHAGNPSPAFSLPSVPTDLPDASCSAIHSPQGSGTSEDELARRMAALKQFRPSLGSGEEDDNPLGLPSVPTTQPSKAEAKHGGPAGRVGFDDDDMKTWCVVCLEDGTLICPDCDDDVYCSRCWYEMHKGPAAGFDESTHRALQFNRGRKKKKVAIGA